jgi:hypothetical protein
MKKIIFILILQIGFVSYGQVRVALQHNGTTTLFAGLQPLQDAISAANNNDTIYLPGGSFGGIGISKKLTIFGTGYYPDSTAATGISIVSDLTFSNGSDNSHIEGLNVTGSIVTSWGAIIDSVVITKCYITGYVGLSGSYSVDPKSDNWQLYRNVIKGGVDCSFASNFKCSNNIIEGAINNIKENGLISNNIFLTPYNYWAFNNVNYSVMQNNVILTNYVSSGQFNLIQKNIIVDATPTIAINNTMNGNFYPVLQNDIFVSQTGNTFNYGHNYHLKTPASYLGSDGLEVGIYGWLHPYKEAAVPFNPHISAKQIAPTTNSTGKLNVDIKVSAQDQ